ncbi:MAG: hypothetical protein QHC79_28250 [Pseudosphingobacterium sp.]|nr:hypothetical protein [Pseudosphingobacterium sp.]
MLEKILSDIWPFLLSSATALIGWWTGRPKQKVEIESGEVDNASKVLEMSGRIADRLEAQLAKSDEVIAALKKTIIQMSHEGEACRKRAAQLQADCDRLQLLNYELQQEKDKLKADHDNLKSLLSKN